MDLDIRQEELEDLDPQKLEVLRGIYGLPGASLEEIADEEEMMFESEQSLETMIGEGEFDWDARREELEEMNEDELNAVRAEWNLPGASIEEILEEEEGFENAVAVREQCDPRNEKGPGTETWRLDCEELIIREMARQAM